MKPLIRGAALALGITAAAGCGSSGGSTAPATSAQAVAAGATLASSAHYRLLAVVGEPVNGGGASSAHYRLQGGVVGALGSLP